MKKSIIVLLSFVLCAFCARFPTTFMEEKITSKQGEEDKLNFQYFSDALLKPEELVKFNPDFRASNINHKDRANQISYSKLFFDENQKPYRVENYRQDIFNKHLYYPYQIMFMTTENDQVLVSIQTYSWINDQLTAGPLSSKAFQKELDGDFDKLMEAFKSNPESTDFTNLTFRFNFLIAINEHNKAEQTTIVANKSKVVIDGYNTKYPDAKIQLFFFDQTRGEVPNFILGKDYPLIMTLGKMTKNHLEFVFIKVDEEKGKVETQQSKEMSNMENSIYKKKDSE